MAAFSSPPPSLLERTVADSLLCLSSFLTNDPPQFSSSSSFSCFRESQQSVSNSCFSALTSDDSSMKIGSDSDPLQFLSMAAFYLDNKMKVVRKNRSHKYRISDVQRMLSAKLKKREDLAMESETKGESVLSSSSSAVSDGLSWNRMRVGECFCSDVLDGLSCNRVRIGESSSSDVSDGLSRNRARIGKDSSSAVSDDGLRRKRIRKMKRYRVGQRRTPAPAGSTRLKSRAEAILKFLSFVGCVSEVKIRSALGDNPDTSKALRMLLKLQEVKRSGAGGHRDPFLYAVAGLRSRADSS